MAKSERIPCEVWEIVFPDWSRIDKEKQESIWHVLNTWSEFVGSESSRKGFAPQIKRVGDLVAGFYIQEGLRESLQGGDTPESLRHGQQANFEKVFFALILDLGYVVLQSKKLFDYVNLNYTQMRNDFEVILNLVLNRAGIPTTRIQMTKFYRKRTQEQMRALFHDNVSLEIEVSGLYGKTVPETIQLSNPDPSEELILKRIFNRDYQAVDGVNLSAAPGKDLRFAKSAKAAVNTGEVHKIVTQLVSGGSETIYAVQDEKVNLPIDDYKEVVTTSEMDGIIEIIERRIRIPVSVIASNRPLPDFGPLFRGIDGKPE
jgi:hypothetical protein